MTDARTERVRMVGFLQQVDRRVQLAFVGQHAVILHAFRKKTGPVPPGDKRLAQTRLVDVVRRYEQGLITFKRQER